MNINGKTIVAIRKLSSSMYPTKAGMKEKLVIGISLSSDLLAAAGLKIGKHVELHATKGKITATFIASKDVEKMQRDVAAREGKGKSGKLSSSSKAAKGKVAAAKQGKGKGKKGKKAKRITAKKVLKETQKKLTKKTSKSPSNPPMSSSSAVPGRPPQTNE